MLLMLRSIGLGNSYFPTRISKFPSLRWNGPQRAADVNNMAARQIKLAMLVNYLANFCNLT